MKNFLPLTISLWVLSLFLYPHQVYARQGNLSAQIYPSVQQANQNQTVTWNANAESSTGISKIDMYVNARIVKTCLNTSFCNYSGGPFPNYAGTSVSYAVKAWDRTGNSVWSGYSFISIRPTEERRIPARNRPVHIYRNEHEEDHEHEDDHTHEDHHDEDENHNHEHDTHEEEDDHDHSSHNHNSPPTQPSSQHNHNEENHDSHNHSEDEHAHETHSESSNHVDNHQHENHNHDEHNHEEHAHQPANTPTINNKVPTPSSAHNHDHHEGDGHDHNAHTTPSQGNSQPVAHVHTDHSDHDHAPTANTHLSHSPADTHDHDHAEHAHTAIPAKKSTPNIHSDYEDEHDHNHESHNNHVNTPSNKKETHAHDDHNHEHESDEEHGHKEPKPTLIQYKGKNGKVYTENDFWMNPGKSFFHQENNKVIIGWEKPTQEYDGFAVYFSQGGFQGTLSGYKPTYLSKHRFFYKKQIMNNKKITAYVFPYITLASGERKLIEPGFIVQADFTLVQEKKSLWKGIKEWFYKKNK